jgi:hypothetical protein
MHEARPKTKLLLTIQSYACPVIATLLIIYVFFLVGDYICFIIQILPLIF